MANLAIRGHETRGKEVIEILEMLGGKNIYDRSGEIDIWYILASDNVITAIYLYNEKGFTLEEFLEKFPYKVGDRVRIPEYESEVRIYKMRWSNFGYVEYLVYRCDDEEWYTAEELLEYNEPHNEETITETNKTIFEGNAHCCDIMNDIIKDNIEERKYAELRMPLDDDDKLSTEVTIDGNKIFPPENYLIGKITKVDNGMLVEYVKKQSDYPKTYKECCEVLGITFDYPDIRDVSNVEFHLYSNFIRLIRYRDAYWKLAGEQMGLGKPWQPDYTDESYEQGSPKKYVIYYTGTYITKGVKCTPSHILSFPTEEMRDAFYENFKELIEACKELL